MALTPGGVDQDLGRLGYKRIRRPMFPLDPDMADPDLSVRWIPLSHEPFKRYNMSDLPPKVTGIGGVFFKSEDPAKVREWYKQNLGLAMNDWGSAFEFRNAHNPDEINYLSWSPFDEKTSYFEPSKKQFMINYRVQNLAGLLEQLKANGITIVDSVAEYEYGKFVHIMDLEGNILELWEPVDHVFTEMGGETTK